jgi:rhodanese-related sulfurtransferase
MFPIFLEFLVEKWILVAAWMTLLYMILLHESRKAGKSVTPQQLSDMVNKQDGIVLDIRDNNEFRQGHIVGAVNIPFRDLEKRMQELAEQKNKPVIVVCKIGQTASSATKQLKSNGFDAVFKLSGGLSEWTAANLPLVK